MAGQDRTQEIWAHMTKLGAGLAVVTAAQGVRSVTGNTSELMLLLAKAVVTLVVFARLFFGDSSMFGIEQRMGSADGQACLRESTAGGVLLIIQSVSLCALSVTLTLPGTEYFAALSLSLLAANVLWLLARVVRNERVIQNLLRNAPGHEDIPALFSLNHCMLLWLGNNLVFVFFAVGAKYAAGSRDLFFCGAFLVSSIVDFVATWRIYRSEAGGGPEATNRRAPN